MHYSKRTDGFRSGLEKKVADLLTSAGIKFSYEKTVLKYVKPSRPSRYTPDFRLPNGVFIETKGLFTAQDRAKHLLVREQNPGIDIRFLFQNAKNRLYKGSKTTYADWCNENGFRWAQGGVPKSWLE